MGLHRRILGCAAFVALAGGLLGTAAPVLAAPPEAPTLTVEAPAKANEATVNGVLNPGKVGVEGTYELDEYQFLYKASTTECKGGNAAPTPPGLSLGGGDEALPAQTLSGLTPDTEYTVCLRAENSKGEATVSPAVSFTTAEATAPTVEAQSANTEGGVTLSATINPGGAATTCEVRYGKTAALEATPVKCPAELPAGDTGQSVAIKLQGLEPKVEYHFEFVAANAKGTAPAAGEATFKTGPYPPPFVLTLGSKEVKRARATLEGIFFPSEEEKTTYYFEYGTEACNLVAETCGAKTLVRGPVTGFTFGELTELKITRLKPGTTYHFWFVASGPGGAAHGEEMTFATATAEPEEYVFDKDLKVSTPQGVGVNQVTGDVYVVNYGANAIEQFNAEGTLQSSVKLSEGSTETWQLAVDNSGVPGQQGDVYVADVTENVVYKFDPAGAKDASDEGKLEQGTPAEIGIGALSAPHGVAIDSSGNVYIASAGSGVVSEFSSAGALLKENLITGLNTPLGLGIDTSGNIYVVGISGAEEYASDGQCVESCKPINEAFDENVALDAAGDIFISNAISEPFTVKEYGPTIGHPSIQNPVLEREGTFPGYPKGVAVDDANHTLYVAENNGALQVFRFLAAKPVIVKTEPATEVDSVEKLNGTVNPDGQEPAEYYFEYGTSPCNIVAETCGTVVTEPSQVRLDGDEEIPVSVRLDNLAPNTTYHYWLVGVNEESGVEHGAEQTFTTGPEVSPPPGPQPEGGAPESKSPASSPVYPLLASIVPVPGPKEVVKKTLTRAQLLAKALATCNHKPRKQRASCKRQARRKYEPVTKGVAKKRHR